MLPAWWVDDVWGRTYWDWDNPMMCGMVSMCADHIMKYPAAYPNWETDLRNILSLVWNRNSADPKSFGEVYSGAWAFPESSVCCGTSLSYNQYTAGPTLIRFGVLAKNEWAREIGRRMMIMATYDSLPNGVVKDGLFGDQVATAEWSNLAHPWPLCQVMESIAWLPKEFGPNRENHIMRSTSVIQEVRYGKGKIEYRSFDAPKGTEDVLRLSFLPTLIEADHRKLKENSASEKMGYSIDPLPNGDCIVTIRRDGRKNVVVEGNDPQQIAEAGAFNYSGQWAAEQNRRRASARAGDEVVLKFSGNQVRVLGDVGPEGGWANAFVDGVQEPTVVECWNPTVRREQPIFFKKGLRNGPHEVKLVVRGEKNPLANGQQIWIDGAQYSAATGEAGFGAGGGPQGAQRMIFGYTGREDFIDSDGNAWKPGTEFVARTGFGVDTVARTWWTARRSMYIGGAKDEEIYRYGVHAPEFCVNVTVGPGDYLVRLHWADTPETAWVERERRLESCHAADDCFNQWRESG